MRPEFDDPYEAARVSSFIEEAALGRWQVGRFTVDEHEARVNVARAISRSDSVEEANMRVARNVPPGEYVSLRRKMTADEIRELEEEGTVVYDDGSEFTGWTPVMSDTPSEISEHREAIENATGRVLVTGLGLGMVVSALLAKPDVEHITVVEIDRDVIGLTGHYYSSHPRVTIVNDDALEYAEALQAGDGSLLFDYAWHDIWSHISYRNLDDDTLAEHGISYATLFEAYESFAYTQGAWAYAEALTQRGVFEKQRAMRAEFVRVWRTGTPEQKVEALIDNIIRDQIGMTVAVGESFPDEVREFFIEQFDLRTWAERIVREDGLDIDLLESHLHEPDDPVGNPNQREGANIAGH
jgi:hypothetical protein